MRARHVSRRLTWAGTATFVCLAARNQVPSPKPPKVAQVAKWESVLTETANQRLGPESANVADVAFLDSGDIIVADSQSNSVSLFSMDGAQRQRFGEPGRKPGQFTAIWRVAADGNGFVYVLDIKQSRVHVFDREGQFRRAIAFGGTGITAQDMVVGHEGALFLGGYRRSTPSDLTKPTIHRLAEDGTVVNSFYPLDQRTQELNLRSIAGVTLARGPNGTIYGARRQLVLPGDDNYFCRRRVGK